MCIRDRIEHHALRLTKDEWVRALYGRENPPAAQDVIEGRLIQIGLRALELGNNVVLDYGLWGRAERSALRQAGADLGAMVRLRYLDLAPAERRRRIDPAPGGPAAHHLADIRRGTGPVGGRDGHPDAGRDRRHRTD